jgi:membrane-associated phospholipid phosphatase
VRSERRRPELGSLGFRAVPTANQTDELCVSSTRELLVARPRGPAERFARPLYSLKPAGAAVLTAVFGWIVLAAVTIGFGALLVHVLLGGALESWDRSSTHWFADRRSPTLTDLSLFGSWLAETVTVVGIAIVSMVLLAAKRMWRPLGLLVLGLASEVTLYAATTLVIRRHRPFVVQLEELRPYASYPSGHSAAAIVLYISLAVIVGCFTTNRVARSTAWMLVAVASAIVGASRLYRGMHHPTDVLAGFAMGIGCVILAVAAVRVAGVVADRTNRGAQDLLLDAAQIRG